MRATNPLAVFYIWEGGIAIYGALIGGAIGVEVHLVGEARAAAGANGHAQGEPVFTFGADELVDLRSGVVGEHDHGGFLLKDGDATGPSNRKTPVYRSIFGWWKWADP